MKKFVYCIFSAIFLFGGLTRLNAQDEITYGLIQSPSDPLMVTAVAYPNFNSTNITISTALFSFYVPEGTVTDPAVPVLPAFGSFNNITGIWRIEKVTPDLYGSLGFDTLDL